MAEVITMPRLSDTMEEGTVAKWLKAVGDKVNEGDILAEIETDKATMEFESFHEGTLLHIGIKEGEGAPVDSLLAIIGEKGEDISALLNGGQPAVKAEEVQTEPIQDVATPATGTKVYATMGSETPKGVEIITMPRLSDTMEEGTVATWLKKVGDVIEEGDILAEIETDKATMEFESFYSGTLLHIGIKEGEGAPVDSLLAIIGPSGTDISAILSGGSASQPSTILEDNSSEKIKANPTTSVEVSSTASNTVSTDNARIYASPLAKKIAQEKGVNLAQIQGTGENGRIIKRDVEQVTPSQIKTITETPAPIQENKVAAPVAVAPIQEKVAAPLVTPTIAQVGKEQVEEVKNATMRKVIAKRLAESKFTAPHYYLTIEVDMDDAMTSRGQINNLPDTKVSFNDMVIKACAMALKKHPQVNTSWNGDTTKIYHHVHMGVAVAVEDGLVVPVLKFADQMSLTQIGNSVKDLAGRARNKKIKPDEMEGSTFTVSNLGMFGIQEFTSIINQPNSAILSVGAIVQKPVVKQGQIVIGNTMTLTLACDHRTVDGATGAQFLQTLRAYLEHPVTMLA